MNEIFCKSCGTKNPDHAIYCSNCGNQLYGMHQNPEIDTLKEKNENQINEGHLNAEIDALNEDFQKNRKMGGYITLGLGVFIFLFGDVISGLGTFVLGAVLLAWKNPTAYILIGVLILMLGLGNLMIGVYFGAIQLLMAASFIFAYNKYKILA